MQVRKQPPTVIAQDISRMLDDGSPADSVYLATGQLESEQFALAKEQLDSWKNDRFWEFD